MSIKNFSVVMSVYENDKPEFVSKAIDSITMQQTLKPDEIILVVDGYITDTLSDLLNKYNSDNPELFNIIKLNKNKGLGNALRIGIEKSKNEIIARMDSDDISKPDRFEKQIAYMSEHPECDVVGGQISEFIDSESNIIGIREVPCSNKKIYTLLKRRCPFNHVSVFLRRSSVLKAGGYIDWFYNEDYYLWIRMSETGCNFANLPDTLVNVRAGMDMYARRGGWKYFMSEKGLQDYMFNHNMIPIHQYIFNISVRFFVQVVLPNRLRGFLFNKLFRKHR